MGETSCMATKSLEASEFAKKKTKEIEAAMSEEDRELATEITKLLSAEVIVYKGVLMFKTIEQRVAEESNFAGRVKAANQIAEELRIEGLQLNSILKIIKNSVPDVFEQVQPEILQSFEDKT